MKNHTVYANPSTDRAIELRAELAREIAMFIGSAENRFFGQPPMRDIRTLRSPSAPPLESISNR